MKIEEIIGRHVEEFRRKRGLTQEELGKQLEPLLGKAWSPQAVSAAEKGRRDFRAADLLGLAVALEVAVPFLLIPLPATGEAIEMPGGGTVTPEEAFYLFSMGGTVDIEGLADAAGGFRTLEEQLTSLGESLTERVEVMRRTAEAHRRIADSQQAIAVHEKREEER